MKFRRYFRFGPLAEFFFNIKNINADLETKEVTKCSSEGCGAYDPRSYWVITEVNF